MNPKTNWLQGHLNKVTTPAKRGAKAMLMLGELWQAAPDLKPADNASDAEVIKSLGGLISRGQACFVLAGELLVRLVDKDPNAYEKILKAHPQYDARFLILLEEIGRGHLHPECLMIGDVQIAAKVERLSYEEQKRVFETPIPVVKKTEGGFKTELKRLKEMNRSEVYSAIGESGVLTVEQQIEQAKASMAQQKVLKQARYVIEGDAIHFIGSPTFKASELEKIVQDLKANAIKSLQTSIKKNQIK